MSDLLATLGTRRMPDRNENLRFTLNNVLVVTTLLAAALSVGHWTESPLLSVHFTLLVLGWVANKFLHASLGGLIPCLLGVDLLTISAIVWAYRGIEPFMFEPILYMLASFLVAIGIAVFLGIASSKRPYWRWQLANAAIFFILLGAWWLVIPAIGQYVVAQQRTRDTTHNNAAMSQAVAEVEAVRQQLGRIPTAEELESQLEEGLPHVREGSHETTIDYTRNDDKSYRLWFIIGWGDINYYDSAQSQKGWQIEPF